MTRGTLPLDWRGGPLPSCHFHISLWTNLCGQTPTKHQAARLPKIRAALRQSNRPESSIFTGLNPLQPKPAFSSLDHVPLAPAAEFWAVRSGPPVSEALARSAGLQVSALRASADRCAVVCEILDPTFCFSLAPVWLLAERVGPERNWERGRTISQLPAGTVQFTVPDELSSTSVAPVSRLTASTQMVRGSSL